MSKFYVNKFNLTNIAIAALLILAPNSTFCGVAKKSDAAEKKETTLATSPADTYSKQAPEPAKTKELVKTQEQTMPKSMKKRAADQGVDIQEVKKEIKKTADQVTEIKEAKKYGIPTGEQEKELSKYLHPYAEEKPEYEKLAIELIKKINLNPNYRFPAARDASISNLIHLATFHGYLNLLKYIVEIGADINKDNKTNWRPLHIAAYLDSEKHKNKLEIVKFLVEHGAILDNKIADLPTPISLIQPKTKIDFDVFYYLNEQMSKSKALMPGGAAGKI